MAMYLFKRKIDDHFANGVDFKHHLYVAEVDANTSEPQYDRDDHNHVLKTITTFLRRGLIPNVDLRYFVDALNDPHTGVTYTALTGKRKQSVPDCEKLFSPGVIKFMKDNGHQEEARIVELIHNWLVMEEVWMRPQEDLTTWPCWTGYSKTGCHGSQQIKTTAAWI